MKDTGLRTNPILIIAVAILVLLGSMWIASQGGLRAIVPGKFAASVYLIITSIPILAVLWLGAAGWGYPIRRWLAPGAACGISIQVAAGLGSQLLLAWLMAWAGLLHQGTAWILCAVGAALLGLQWHRQQSGASTVRRGGRLPWTVLLLMPAVGLLVVACTCPPGTLWSVEAYGYDVLSYHLQLPKQWLEIGAMSGLDHNVFSYLPNLAEIGSMQIGAMCGSVYAGLYIVKFFHASVGVLAALTLGHAALSIVNMDRSAFCNRNLVLGTASILLSVPWIIITASLAYTEMFVLALGSAALACVFDPIGQTRRGAALAGAFVGAATAAKLPAGPMIAVPTILILLLRLNLRWGVDRRWHPAIKRGAVAMLGCLVVLSPYFIRNIVWTGNPVFPFATSLLGDAHWDETLVQRWEKAHGASGGLNQRLSALNTHWLTNAGYGAIGTRPLRRAVGEVAYFSTESGLPVLWLAAMSGGLLGLCHRPQRPAVAAAAVLLVAQLLFWWFGTHHQSRFLIPTLLAGCLLIALGFDRLNEWTRSRVPWVAITAVGLLVGLLLVQSYRQFFGQTIGGVEPWSIIDSAPLRHEMTWESLDRHPVGDHPLNYLVPPEGRVYMVADCTGLLYVRCPMTYHSAFDASLLGRMIRANDCHPIRITDALHKAGYTHVWIHWSELRRLRAHYGFDEAVTEPMLRRLIATGWNESYAITNRRDIKIVSLYALPSRPP